LDFAFSNISINPYIGSPLEGYLSTRVLIHPVGEKLNICVENFEDCLVNIRHYLSNDLSALKGFIQFEGSTNIKGEETTSAFIEFLERIKEHPFASGRAASTFPMIALLKAKLINQVDELDILAAVGVGKAFSVPCCL